MSTKVLSPLLIEMEFNVRYPRRPHIEQQMINFDDKYDAIIDDYRKYIASSAYMPFLHLYEDIAVEMDKFAHLKNAVIKKYETATKNNFTAKRTFSANALNAIDLYFNRDIAQEYKGPF
ncbi:hypothetical protein M3Y96_00991400 [Aphelenchoides besseyi]|nr:hypothetical protein M3Y96_00991400 [Aphelenchoides besseyi]